MSTSDALVGRSVGEFVLRAKIGEGGFGAVYRCEQPLLGRQAVIKVLLGQLRADDVVIQRFLREARLASRIDHPYAAHVYAFGVEKSDGLMWIAMEMVDGVPLDKWLTTRGPLPLADFVPFFERIAEVVQTAHDRGIVHRDIKPSNVMVIERAGRLLPKLLDLGIAKLRGDGAEPQADVVRPATDVVRPPADDVPLTIDVRRPTTGSGTNEIGSDATMGAPVASISDEAAWSGKTVTAAPDPAKTVTASASGRMATSGDVELTADGATLGSPPYIAPEQWQGSAQAGAPADLYALGVLAYEALAGRRPFFATNIAAYAALHLYEAVPPIGVAPPALDRFFARALAKRPEDRFPNALALAAGLRAASGLGAPDADLPRLDAALRDAWLAEAPQPLAETVAALDGARNAHQARDAAWELIRGIMRYVAAMAMASRAHVREEHTDPQLADLVRAACRRDLDDAERVRLVRAIARPFATRRGAFPIPALLELVTPGADGTDAFDRVLGLNPTSDAGGRIGDDHVRAYLAQLVPELQRLMRGAAFILDYPLVVSRDGAVERWTGLRRPRRPLATVREREPLDRRPALLDRRGQLVLELWPLLQPIAPNAGADDELFVLDGHGRHGARLIAAPMGFEHRDPAVWEWLAEHVIGEPATTATASDERAPYLGLAAFETSDADRFVGREREIDALVNRLRLVPLQIVVGASGAGKSSFVHAGVVPALPTGWKVVSLRPGTTPAKTLAAKLSTPAHDGMLVVVVDQLEETFTLCTDDGERTRFAERLVELTNSADARTRVVCTVRDDFLMRFESLAPLRTRLSPALFLLGNPARDDLVRCIVEPARRAGYTFSDPELPAMMVDAMAERPGALALLSFTASRLWELRDRRLQQLTRSAYDAIGGVAGAIAQHAEATLAECQPHEQRLARIALGHLVTADGTRASLRRGELTQLMRDPAATAVLEKLVAARMLVATETEGGDDQIELVHESLVVAWPRLAEWRREDSEGARLRDQIRVAARQWIERDKPSGLLWRDDALAELQVWQRRHPQRLTDAEDGFVRASTAAATRGRRLRRGAIGVIVALMAVTVAVLLWARHNLQVTAARDRARVRDELVERGRQSVLAGDDARAREALAEARRMGVRDSAALRVLESAAQRPIEGQVAILRASDASVQSVELSPDGALVLVVSNDLSARVWDRSTGSQRAQLEGCEVIGASFDPTGRHIAAECADAIVRVYASDGRLERSLAVAQSDGEGARMRQYAYARWFADGERLATTSRGRLEVWDVSTGERRWLAEVSAPQGRIAIAPDGKMIASMTKNEPTVSLWDADTGSKRRELKLVDSTWDVGFTEPTALAFDRDGARLFTVARRTDVVEIWDVNTGARLGQLEPRAGVIYAIQVSDEGARAAIASETDVQIWQTSTGRLEYSLDLGDRRVRTIQLDADDRVLAAATTDGAVLLWDMATGKPLTTLHGHQGRVAALAFGPSGPWGSHLITGGSDGASIIWDLRATSMAKIVDLSGAFRMEVRGERALVVSDFAVVLRTTDGEVLARHRVGTDGDARWVDDDTVALLDDRGEVLAWDPSQPTAKLVAKHERGAGSGDVIEVSDDGRIASRTGAELVVSDHGKRFRWVATKPIDSVAFLRRNGRLVVHEQGGALRVFERDGTLVHTATASVHVPMLFALADGRFVAATPDGIEWWSAEGARIEVLSGQKLNNAALDRTRAMIAVATEDSVVRVWGLGGHDPLHTFAHPAIVSDLQFTPNGALLVTIDSVGDIRVWSLVSGELLLKFRGARGFAVLGVTDQTIVIQDDTGLVLYPMSSISTRRH